MNSKIDRIVLFLQDRTMRDVQLDNGLNIITGDSKTGKSALIEIIDYCLFSSRSTIPIGKITNSTDLFCIILEVGNKYLIVARPKWSINNTQAYFTYESNKNFLEDFNLDYFNNLHLRAINIVKADLEEHLGLSVLDTRQSLVQDKRTAGKATLRSFTPFIFQHQNLIANKHSLFYRFDNFYKRKDTIDQLPILLGWVNGEYYNLKQQIDKKIKLLALERKRIKSLKLKNSDLIERIRIPISQYYIGIGIVLEENLNLTQLKKIAKHLPEIPKTIYENSDISKEIDKLVNERKIIRIKLNDLEKLKDQISENSDTANSYAKQISHIVSRSNSDEDSNMSCPFCKSETPEINEIISSVNSSRIELLNELESLGSYKHDSSEQLSKLIEECDLLKKKINVITTQIINFEKTVDEITKQKSLRDGLQFLKGVIQVNVDQLLELPTLSDSHIDIASLEKEIKELQEKINLYDINQKYDEANEFINKRMNIICKRLDFEKELQPGKLSFNLRNFDFYYIYKDKNISLSEMGSGANWLACHLSLFISLLELTTKENDSCIPTFLILDQPSQVYFPKARTTLIDEINQIEDVEEKKEADENIIQVKNIFNVMVDELNYMKNELKFMPQIIVMEHADELEFNKYVKKRWYANGEKLI